MFPQALQNLIDQLSKLPGLGQRSASRMAIWLLNQPAEELQKIAEAIANLKKQTNVCSICFNLTTNGNQLCDICKDHQRDHSTICVVEDILDISPIEKTRYYQGVYHILGGTIFLNNKINSGKLKIQELIKRIQKLPISATNTSPVATNAPFRHSKQGEESQLPIKEIILAFNPSAEGDATSLYLEKTLKSLGVKITKLGRGLSSGSDLEYADEITLSNALKNRL